MTVNRMFEPLDTLPADWPDSLSQFISTIAAQFQVTIGSDPTTLQVVAGTDNVQVAVAINGRWRFNTATVSAAGPGGGSARNLDVWVTATDNSFAAGSPGEIDNTDYSFALAIVESGASPSGAILSRHVAVAQWSGTQFTRVTQLVPAAPLHAANHAAGGVDPLFPADIGAATAAALAAEISRAEAAEGLLAPLVSPSLTGTPTVPTVTPDTDATTKAASTAFVWAAIDAALSGIGLSKTLRDSRVVAFDDQTAPNSAASVLGSLPITLAPGQGAVLLGLRYKCTTAGGTVLEVATDHAAHGTLVPVTGLTGITPAVGGYQTDYLGTPMVLSDGDEVAVIATTPGGSLGLKAAPVIQYTF